MSDVDKTLHDLSKAARSSAAPTIDVRARVIRTLADQRLSVPLDTAPITFAGAVIAVAAGVVIALMPTWRVVSEPWIAYLP